MFNEIDTLKKKKKPPTVLSYFFLYIQDWAKEFLAGKPVAEGVMTRLFVRRLGTWFITTERGCGQQKTRNKFENCYLILLVPNSFAEYKIVMAYYSKINKQIKI